MQNEELYNYLSTLNYIDNFKKVYNLVENKLKSYRTKNDNILVSQLQGMGDLILASSFIRELRKNYPNNHITLFCTYPWNQLYELCPYINRIIVNKLYNFTYKTYLLDALNICCHFLWNKQYNLAFNTHWSIIGFFGSIINWMSISNYNIGYSFEAERQYFGFHKHFTTFLDKLRMDKYILTKAIINPPNLLHEVDRKLYILEKLKLKVENKNLELWLSNNDINKATNILYNAKRKIAIGLASSDAMKNYPVNKLIIALKEIIKDNNTLILLGGNNDIDKATYLENNIKCINLVNKLTLRETAAIIKQSDLYIGNDTGIMHIAAAFNKPIIYYSREAKNFNSHLGVQSSILRFHPYYGNDINKYIVLQPESRLDNCNLIDTYGGCCANEEHCITQIQPEEIIQAYFKIKKDFL